MDEVLFCDKNGGAADPELRGSLKKRFPQSVRFHVGSLMKELRNMGYDVWVYTSGYMSDQEIRSLFQAHGGNVYGIINGLKSKSPDKTVTEGFRNKYQTIVHVDNQSLMCVNTETKNYNVIDFDKEKDWATQVYQTLNGLGNNS